MAWSYGYFILEESGKVIFPVRVTVDLDLRLALFPSYQTDIYNLFFFLANITQFLTLKLT